jgi:tetratricopeptide (TPR) repeat protein
LRGRASVGALALGLWSAWQGYFYYLVNALPAALRVLDRARDIANEHGLAHIEFLSLYFRAVTLAQHRRWLAEPLYQGLMRCYAALNRHAEARSAYRRLRQTLSVTLGIAPSSDSESLARTLLAR